MKTDILPAHLLKYTEVMYALLYTRQGIFSFFVSLWTVVLLMFFYFAQSGSPIAKGLTELPEPQESAVKLNTEAAKSVSAAEHIAFLDDYASAVEESKKQKKPLLVYFFISGETGSKNTSGNNYKINPFPVFSNAEVKTLSNQFVCTSLEACRNAVLCKTLEVNKYPSVLLFDVSGAEVRRLSGKQAEQELALGMHFVIQASAAKASSALR